MRYSLLIALLVPFFAFGHSAIQLKPSEAHPIIGQWTWTREANNCTETYRFRLDGTTSVSSGAEKSDSTYQISDVPSSNGFYKLTDRITKDYGGKDCANDDTDSAGHEATIFVIFHRSGNMLLMCESETLDACFGPLHRVDESNEK
jgi:hypothetical protein